MKQEQKLIIISFTANGSRLNARLKWQFDETGHDCTGYTVSRFAGMNGLNPIEEGLDTLVAGQWGKSDLIFIGSAGIAVRSIAPYVKDKYTDSAVIVMDEQGKFVIPLLSSHVGGAVKLAREAAAYTGGIPVITTATDVNHQFAVDVFAVENNLTITNRELVKKISAAVLDNQPVGFYSRYPVRGAVPEPLNRCNTMDDLGRWPLAIAITGEEDIKDPGVLKLSPQPEKNIVVGIGCRRGTGQEQLEAGLSQVMASHQIKKEQLAAFVSIDLKKNEPGLCQLAEAYGLPFITYSVETLNQVKAVCSSSAFVEKTTGVDNVCERAAKAFFPAGQVIQPKIAVNGCTFSLAEQKREVFFDGSSQDEG